MCIGIKEIINRELSQSLWIKYFVFMLMLIREILTLEYYFKQNELEDIFQKDISESEALEWVNNNKKTLILKIGW